MSSSTYLLAGQVSELERLQLQSRVWEPSGRRLLAEIGDGRGGRAVDIGCGVMGWLGLLSEWVGQDGEVVGTDIDDATLSAAEQFVADEGLGNVLLRNDDLFDKGCSLHPSTWCTRGSSSPRWVVATNRWRPTYGCSAPAAPSS
jgi:methylase of polypeptide subunit release factors